MLLDTASLYFRAFYGVPETVAAPDGTPVNAIRGLLDMITRLVRARHPARTSRVIMSSSPRMALTGVPSGAATVSGTP